MKTNNRPTIRMIHHLHRTGGTLISKCLASLPNTSMLSEINPRTPEKLMVLDPTFQASFWLRLLTEKDESRLQTATFLQKIIAIQKSATQRGDALIIRNWAYLDFFAKPFLAEPSNELSTVSALEDEFELLHVVTVRHPIDQWLSWCNYAGSAKAAEFTFADFIDACIRFRDQTCHLPFVKYEDFAESPKVQMKRMCDILELCHDPIFLRRWPHYHQITGDNSGRASSNGKIESLSRRAMGESLTEEALGNPKYLDLLSYYKYT